MILDALAADSLLSVRPHEVELLRPGRTVPPLAWMLLGSGLLAAAAAVAACLPAWRQQQELQAQWNHVQARLEHDLPGAGGTRGKSGSRAGSEALDTVTAVAYDLRRPWHELLDQLENAQKSDGDVHLTQLSIDPRFQSVQMVVEGRDLDRLMRFSQRLSGTLPLQSTTLTHHEWRDTLGAHVVVATLQGRLAPQYTSGGGAIP